MLELKPLEIGARFGKLVVVASAESIISSGKPRAVYVVRCVCGWQKPMLKQAIIKAKSCGMCPKTICLSGGKCPVHAYAERRRYYLKHKANILHQQKAYNSTRRRKEWARRQSKAWNLKNQDYVKRYRQLYYRLHHEEIRQKRAAYYQEHREYFISKSKDRWNKKRQHILSVRRASYRHAHERAKYKNRMYMIKKRWGALASDRVVHLDLIRSIRHGKEHGGA